MVDNETKLASENFDPAVAHENNKDQNIDRSNMAGDNGGEAKIGSGKGSGMTDALETAVIILLHSSQTMIKVIRTLQCQHMLLVMVNVEAAIQRRV